MATVTSPETCPQCKREAMYTTRFRDYDDLDCFYCGFSHKIKDLPFGEIPDVNAPLCREYINDGYVLVEGKTYGGEQAFYLEKVTKGCGAIHTENFISQLIEPMTEDVELSILADENVSFASKWDEDNSCLIVVKGVEPEYNWC